MEERWICRIIGMTYKISGEYSSGKACWRRYGTTGMDTLAEEMWASNRRDVGLQRWQMRWKDGEGLGNVDWERLLT